jgi:TetR/AcrR family transcriptional regulator
MSDSEKNTEQQILNAAKTVFLKKGFDGARMQEIADEAGMNKALLHYYFRSKDKLFDAIFQEAFQQFLPQISETMISEKPFIEKIWFFIDSYIELMLNNPHLPIFILNEINRNPGRLVNIIKGFGIRPEIFLLQIEKEMDAGNIHPVDPRHLLVNMLSMCIFPFAGRPMVQAMLFGNDAAEYQKFLIQRKTEVTLFIMNALKPR